METLLIIIAAFCASLLTFYSGFGLGTLLMPVVAIFFPLPVAVAITAIVHLLNNLFKVFLLGARADRKVVIGFGLPALLAALVGASLLIGLAELPVLLRYQLAGREIQVSLIKIVMGCLILLFAVLELSPRFARLSVDSKYLPLGGLLSGFFGGLSGHQGALRSMFLIKSGLDKEAYVATAIVIAVMVDISRMLIYGTSLLHEVAVFNWTLVALTCAGAFAGAWLGKRLLKKVTIESIRLLVACLLIFVGVGLISGLL
jgi:uncharacterized membrane protein YfcA